jgi:hypothetical protein
MIAFAFATALAALTPNPGAPGAPIAAPAGYQAQIAENMREIAHTVTHPAMTPVRKGVLWTALGLMAYDQIRTQACLAHGGHEMNPIARPFVHYLPLGILSTALLAFGAHQIPAGNAGDAGLGLFDAAEIYNLARPWGC